jgi:hypothetical protein
VVLTQDGAYASAAGACGAHDAAAAAAHGAPAGAPCVACRDATQARLLPRRLHAVPCAVRPAVR